MKLKYQIYNTDTIKTVLNKIAVSINDIINSDHIFAFINYPTYDNKDISELEKKIIPNDKLRDFIKENFSNLHSIQKDIGW